MLVCRDEFHKFRMHIYTCSYSQNLKLPISISICYGARWHKRLSKDCQDVFSVRHGGLCAQTCRMIVDLSENGSGPWNVEPIDSSRVGGSKRQDTF